MAIKRVFSLQEAAEYIGVGENTLHVAIAPNTKNSENLRLIPPHFERIGKKGTVIFLREDLDAWKRVNSRQALRKRRRRKKPAVLSVAVINGEEVAAHA